MAAGHERGFRRAIARLLGGEAGLGTCSLVRWAALLGLAGGLSEALYLTIRHAIVHRPAAWYYPEVLWMAPLAMALACVLLAIGLGLAARIAGSGVAIGKATFIFALPGIYGVIQSRGIPLHPAAKVVIALGLAAVAARATKRWQAGVDRIINRSALPVAVLVIALLAWGLVNLPRVVERRALAGLPEAGRGAPNILLIILDTVRASNLGLYGYARPTSPSLDRWSASGVVFERAIATAPWTLPSHASLFTGRYNFEVGTSFTQPMDATYPTLAGTLAANGYATAGFVANLSYTSRASGLHRGFARYEDFPVTPAMFTRSAWLPAKLSGAIARVTGLWAWDVPKRAVYVTDEFEEWLAARPDRPFFVFLNYFDAHDPYDPPPPYRERFGPAPSGELSDERQYTPEEVEPWLNAYDGAISYIDDQLAHVFEALDTHGLTGSTIVVVTSDHGEMFGENGQVRHTSGLYMPALHVPLIVSFPGTVPPAVRVTQPVTLRDVPATILELVGLGSAGSLPGTSLAAYWRRDEDGISDSPVLAELDFQESVAARKPLDEGQLKSLVDGRLHYILYGNGDEELFDVVADPSAARDLADRPEWHQSLERFRAALAAIFADAPS